MCCFVSVNQRYEHRSCWVKDRRLDLNGLYQYRYGIDNWDREQWAVLQPGGWMRVQTFLIVKCRMLQMFCAGPRTLLANSCAALGNKPCCRKCGTILTSCITVSYSKTILPQGFVYSRTPKSRTSTLWAYKLYIVPTNK